MIDNHKCYIGIDIGLQGAIAIQHGASVVLYKMPTIDKLVNIHALCGLINTVQIPGKTHVCFEKLSPIFKTSKAATWSLAFQAGVIETMCVFGNIPYTKVQAKDWQKELFVGISEITNSEGKRDTKKMADVAATRLFPQVNFIPTEKSKKKHEGMIDALLISEWAKRHNL